MKTKIKAALLDLEKQHGFKILYAVESGSRAWGFASTDSDWDVRYLYIHKLDWYLKIDTQPDVQEDMLPDDLDISGWELQKALKLFKKSNPPLLEWLQSPMVYWQSYATADKLRTLTQTYFNHKSCLFHYLHMAEGNYREYLRRDQVKVKKYLYVLRPLLACEWIQEKNSVPPVEFGLLLESGVSDPVVKHEIQSLLERKMAGEELAEEPKNQILNQYIEEKIAFFVDYSKSAQVRKPVASDLLDQVFVQTMREVWGEPEYEK